MRLGFPLLACFSTRVVARVVVSVVASTAAVTATAPTPVAAQDSPSPAGNSSCDGHKVSSVEIRRSARTIVDRKGAPQWARTVLQPLLLGTPTRQGAIAPYMQLHVGGNCTEHRRAESERLLRALPYLADAAVRVFDEADGTVRVEVETIDDIRPIVGLGIRDSKPSMAELGNSNIDGAGHLLAVRWRDGRAFRDGFGLRYADAHVLGGPNVANLSLERAPLGSYTLASLGHPFFSDLQHVAGYAGYLKDDGYASFVRPQGDAMSFAASRERADVGLAFRLNTGGRVSWLIGALASYERRTADDRVVFIRDSGLVDTTSSLLSNRYLTQKSTRAGAVLGMRALTFVKAKGFDGLESVQDVGRGVQLSTTVGKGIGSEDKRTFVTGDFYTGVGTAESFVALRFQMEMRQNETGWGDGVASGRLAWYGHQGRRQTTIISVEYAGSSTHDVPYQLTLDDAESGMRGYSGSTLSGARRLIARAERRLNMPGISRYLGWGLAGFADAGNIWAGDAPFGETAFRSSLGLSVLAAVPRASRSMARVDIAYPLVADRNARGFDIRVSYRVTGRAFWRESAEIARARRGSPSTDIFTWP